MYPDNINAAITCESSAHLSFEAVEIVSIRRMVFIGCGNNIVRNVDWIIFQETVIFQGLDGTETPLTLSDSLTAAEVINCIFVGNQFGTIRESIESLNLIMTNFVWLIVRNVTHTYQPLHCRYLDLTPDFPGVLVIYLD